MKKFVLILVTVIPALISCRKDRTCTCTNNGNNLGEFKYTNVKRSEASDHCAAQQTSYNVTYPNATCSLK